MRNTMLTLLMMIAVGVFASAQGRDTQTLNIQAVDAVGTHPPYVVLAGNATRQQKDAAQECLVIPNRDPRQERPNEQDRTLMKGLVF